VVRNLKWDSIIINYGWIGLLEVLGYEVEIKCISDEYYKERRFLLGGGI